MTLRAQVTFTSGTGLPEDAVTNTLHFGPLGPTDSFFRAEVIAALQSFYTAIPTGGVASVGSYLSPSLSRNTDAAVVELFDLQDPEPRVPVSSDQFTLPAASNPTGLPAEVAVAISWLADIQSGDLERRMRGRNFVGPLNATTSATTVGLTRPSSTFMDDLARAGDDLISTAWSTLPGLVIFSEASPTKSPPQAADEVHPVVRGYVDNAFDTIRSRGLSPTSRILFAV